MRKVLILYLIWSDVLPCTFQYINLHLSHQIININIWKFPIIGLETPSPSSIFFVKWSNSVFDRSGRYLYTNVGRSREVNWNIFNITAKLWAVNRHTLRKNVEFLFDTNWRMQNQHQAFFLRLHLRQGRWWVPCTDNIGSSVNHPVDLHFSEIHRNFFF